MDPQQDVLAASETSVDGNNYLSFTRPLVTGDNFDKNVIGCHYLLLAQGPVRDGDIAMHDIKLISSEPVCISTCGKYILLCIYSCSDAESTLCVHLASTRVTDSIWLYGKSPGVLCCCRRSSRSLDMF